MTPYLYLQVTPVFMSVQCIKKYVEQLQYSYLWLYFMKGCNLHYCQSTVTFHFPATVIIVLLFTPPCCYFVPYLHFFHLSHMYAVTGKAIKIGVEFQHLQMGITQCKYLSDSLVVSGSCHEGLDLHSSKLYLEVTIIKR